VVKRPKGPLRDHGEWTSRKRSAISFRKQTIKQASWAVVNRPGVTRGNAPMLTIVADSTIELSMPRDKPNVANAIVLALMQCNESSS
jgi:hypothetical protein